MLKILIIITILTCGISKAQAQESIAGDALSKKIIATYLGDANMQSDPVYYEPSIEGIGIDHKSSNTIEDSIQQAKTMLKLKALENGSSAVPKKSRANEPLFAGGFTANSTSSSPPDNTLAINTKGQIVSLINANIRIYNTTGTSLYLKSLYSFLNLGLIPGQDTFVSTLCDPKVFFDCEKKRYIAFVMTCDAKADHSKIMFAFSKDEDPLLGWNVYTLIADQFNKSVWFDHPRIGINGFDVFASGNMFTDAKSYVETNIYQLDKLACYNAAPNPSAWAYHGLSANPFTPSFANDAACGNTGDKSYFIATQGGGGSNSLKFYTLTGRASNATTPTIAYQAVTVPTYSSPGHSPQPNTSVLLRTGDCRTHDAYYLNGKINLAFHTDAGLGFSGIYLTRLKNTSGTWSNAQTKVFKVANTDLTYPSIAHYGTSLTDETTIIGYLSSSNTIYGSMNAVIMDPNLNSGTPLLIKSGVNYIDYLSQTNSSGTVTSRWGDYTGLTPMTNATVPSVWFSGMYANTNKNWTNYICRLNRFWDVANGTIQSENIDNTNVQLFPNPVMDNTWKMEIKASQNILATFILTSLDGKIISTLYHGVVKAGNNSFSFNTQSLSPGVYLVNVFTKDKVLQSQKLIVAK